MNIMFQFEHGRYVVWLMLYELHTRGYVERMQKEKLACDSEWGSSGCNPNLLEVAKALWQYHIKIAASISRTRIRCGAVRLSDLLPRHLRDSTSGPSYATRPITAWANKHKISSPLELIELLRNELGLEAEDFDERQNIPVANKFRWCPLCPMFVLFAPEDRVRLSASSLVRLNKLVLQERAFCFGAAALCKRMHELDLEGNILLTHVTTPRATAYLAQLLQQNTKVSALLVYGAGDRKREIEQLISELGEIIFI